MVHYKAYTFTD